MKNTITIAVANQKGGVGKTTITREISACCALRGYKVLAVDCDPQANLTSTWVDPEIYSATLAHVLLEPEQKVPTDRADPERLESVIVETPLVNLDLVPSDIRLARFDMQPDYLTYRLRNELVELNSRDEDPYDLVFIDCPPALGKLLTAALYAARYVLIPCGATRMGLPGLADFHFTVRRVRENVNPELEILGAVINQYVVSRNLSGQVREEIEGRLDLVNHVFTENIHSYSKIAEAPGHRLPVVKLAPDHRASVQLWALTDEVLGRMKLPLEKRMLAAVKGTGSAS